MFMLLEGTKQYTQPLLLSCLSFKCDLFNWVLKRPTWIVHESINNLIPCSYTNFLLDSHVRNEHPELKVYEINAGTFENTDASLSTVYCFHFDEFMKNCNIRSLHWKLPFMWHLNVCSIKSSSVACTSTKTWTLMFRENSSSYRISNQFVQGFQMLLR